MNQFPQHTFHIPVMGLAYTIDSPIKVARFGIASVISIVEDGLIEMMRSYYYPATEQVYHPITKNEEDYRAKRITDYLNLVNKIVTDQMEKIKQSAFETGSEIVKYFEMLPDDSKLKQLYRHMVDTPNNLEKQEVATYLRTKLMPGSIDVNIMTKIDSDKRNEEGAIIDDGSEAVTALKGYIQSNLTNSSVIFSAGMNPRLYNYLEKCDAFDADEHGDFKKKIVIKVSDYRSAIIQGKYLAKKGIWVSEFRIESGLNCGGHAFATDGYLMGPIMEEFKTKKEELVTAIFEVYNNAIKAKGRSGFNEPHPVKITAQGGIGTYEEDIFLHEHYGINSTGWGTPFLVVPEATTVDDNTLDLLCKAGQNDLVLSNNSPLGVRFHYLKGTTADIEKQERIKKGKPGSPCSEKHLAFNTEFTTAPICTASHKYQQLKIAHLKALQLTPEDYKKQLNTVLDKECLCVGLSNAASKVYQVPFVKRQEAVTICPGPNIVYFNKVVSLQTMTDHIYGRTNIVKHKHRPHMFIAELRLYINYLEEKLAADAGKEPDKKKNKYYQEYLNNLLSGIKYYQQLQGVALTNHPEFSAALELAKNELNEISFQFMNKDLANHSLLQSQLVE